MFQRIAQAHEDAEAYGAEHPDTLTTRQQFAYWTGEAGDPARARDLLTALLPDTERALGADHPTTLTTRSNLDYWTQETTKEGGSRQRS
jgi:hypothetical protein